MAAHLRGFNRPSPQALGDVRFSQVISTFGPGALMNLPDGGAFVVSGLDDWSAGATISEPRLTARLRVARLCAPPAKSSAGGIPCRKFPRWARCPACGLLQRDGDDCPKCAKRMTPSRFIRICKRGHLDEFNYDWWVHGGQGTCRGPLYLEDTGRSGSLADLVVLCPSCNASKSMEDALQFSGGCSGRRPWLNDYDPEQCTEQMKGSLRGASNVYFSATHSALSIPPFSNPIFRALEEFLPTLLAVDEVTAASVLASLLKQDKLPRGTTVEQAINAVRAIQGQSAHVGGELREEEYDALTHPALAVDLGPPAPDFQTRAAGVPREFEQTIAQVILVERLREVRALVGFTRVESRDEQDPDSVVIAPITRAQPAPWFPAIEVRGEGVFIELDRDAVRRWETRPAVTQRLEVLNGAYGDWREGRRQLRGEEVMARQVLLHSLAHLLIRELSLYCGYPMAALRERIYASPTMCGLLIYTATVDSEGSLGGLVQMGRPSRLGIVLRRLLDGALWCSADPLCSEHRPNASGQLVAAACHSCLLMPETSCELGNRFLDRLLVISEGSDTGYFRYLNE